MILDFKLATTNDNMRVTAPQAEFQAEMRAIVGYHVPTRRIVAIGDTAEDIRKNAPQYWEKNGKQIEFVRPFDFAEARSTTHPYEPLIAARVVSWFADKAFNQMKRQGFTRLLLSPWVDRVDYTLQLEGFEKLPIEARRQFVKHLKKLLVAVRRVEINGEKVLGKK
jgi:hypothetical protein